MKYKNKYKKIIAKIKMTVSMDVNWRRNPKWWLEAGTAALLSSQWVWDVWEFCSRTAGRQYMRWTPGKGPKSGSLLRASGKGFLTNKAFVGEKTAVFCLYLPWYLGCYYAMTWCQKLRQPLTAEEKERYWPGILMLLDHLMNLGPPILCTPKVSNTFHMV